MKEKLHLLLFLGIVIVCGLSSFADTADFPKSSSNKRELLDKNESSNESDDDSKEKRSEENIMFGNQQNKANSLADDMIHVVDVSDSNNEDLEHKNDTQIEDANKDDAELENVLKDDSSSSSEKKPLSENSNSNNYYMDMGPSSANWYGSSSSYNGAPTFTDVLGYIGSPQQSINDDLGNIIEPEDIHKRKRQPWVMALRKRRSLRSPLGQMIQTRGRRLPRRSMRFKRQVDVQDILSLLNNADPNTVEKLYDQVPNVYNNYGYPEQSSFRHRYDFINQDKNRPETDDEESISNLMDGFNNNGENEELVGYSEPPAVSLPSRYLEPEDYQMSSVRPSVEEDENQNMGQEWLEPESLMFSLRRPTSVFTVSRRSTPLFYPIDYRFIPGPGFKKRSFSGRHRNDEQETEFGKWGKVVNAPEAYATAEDVARLYDLANLLAENENSEIRARRSI